MLCLKNVGPLSVLVHPVLKYKFVVGDVVCKVKPDNQEGGEGVLCFVSGQTRLHLFE